MPKVKVLGADDPSRGRFNLPKRNYMIHQERSFTITKKTNNDLKMWKMLRCICIGRPKMLLRKEGRVETVWENVGYSEALHYK